VNRGTQVLYVPLHAKGRLTHPDCEYGFVVSECEDCHYVRYWGKGQLGELRTLATSELTPTDLLVERKSVSNKVIKECLAALGLGGDGE